MARDTSFLLQDEPLCCPRGHRVPKHFWLAGKDRMIAGYRCQFRASNGDRECGSGVLQLQIPNVRFLVAASSAELHRMESAQMTLPEIRDYLGLRWRVP
jgi:hypothetical protein